MRELARTTMARGVLSAVVVSVLVGQAGGQADVAVERAGDWEALFDRSTGWTGADGIYSIPLSERDTFAPGGTRTLFVFSDTFIGRVGSDGTRLPGSTLVNNTLALLRGSEPRPDRTSFFWRVEDGRPLAALVPATPASQPDEWYWLLDGIRLGRWVRLFALRMRLGDGGVFNFAVSGVSLVSLPLDSPDPLGAQTQVDTPLHVVPGDGRGEMIFGAGLMPNTAEAGAPRPDGYVYAYGHQNDPLNKKLLVARVMPADIASFEAWRFWDGHGWVADPSLAAPVTDRVSSELSVTPLPDGRYVLVFQRDGLGRDVAARVGTSPVGPFGPVRRLWTCPEPGLDPDIYCYNAKAHPGLSQPGELLISYNVNSFKFADHMANADIYRPRFIRVRMAP